MNLKKSVWLVAGLLTLVFLTPLVAAAAAPAAQNYSWNTTSSGDWATNADWSPNTGHPGLNSADTATISQNAALTVAVNANYSLTSLAIGNALNTNTLTINNGFALALSGGYTNVGIINVGTTSAATNATILSINTDSVTTNSGTINLHGAAVLDGTKIMSNSGTIQGTGTINEKMTNTGYVTASGGKLIVAQNVTNTGGTLKTNGGALDTLTLKNVTGGTINPNGGEVDLNSTLDGVTIGPGT